jgi:hypothetical protein
MFSVAMERRIRGVWCRFRRSMTQRGFFDVFNRAISRCRIVVMGWGRVEGLA